MNMLSGGERGFSTGGNKPPSVGYEWDMFSHVYPDLLKLQITACPYSLDIALPSRLGLIDALFHTVKKIPPPTGRGTATTPEGPGGESHGILEHTAVT